MKLKGKMEARAPVDRVWAFLTDLGQFAGCVPGLESIEQVNDSTFNGVVGVKVGPMTGTVKFTATITERRPPDRMVVGVNGAESRTGSAATASITLLLEAVEERRTRLVYDADVDVTGNLAVVGEMVIRVTAGILFDEFADRMRTRLEGETTADNQSISTRSLLQRGIRKITGGSS